jgi:glycosyltransferase involved in cell wall biosynthesis
MKRMGMNVTAVSGPNEQEPGLFASLRNAGIDCHIIDSLDDRFPYRLGRTGPQSEEVVQSVKPDVIHTMGIGHSLDFHLALQKAKWKARMVCTLESCRHGAFYEGLARRTIARLANHICDHLVVISKIDERKMLRAGARGDKLVYIPNFVDCADFLKKMHTYRDSAEIRRHVIEGRPTIVYLAQMVKRKGHMYLFKALQMVRQRYPDAALLLFGVGEHEHELRCKVSAMGLTDCVRFMGSVPHDYVPAILSKCDLSVISSLSETFGWTIIEPVLAGIPVVSTRVGIAPQVEEAGGLLGVPARDARSMAASILKLLQDDNLKRALLERGADYVKEQFDVESVTKRYSELYGVPSSFCADKADAMEEYAPLQCSS